MGRKTVLLDDYDGAELPDDAAPITLSLGRTTYSLYLSEDNHGKLLEAIDPFIKTAETLTSTPRAAAPARAKAANDDNRNARKWAIETGFKYENASGEKVTLGERGRIPDAVMEAWRVAGSPTFD